MNKLRRVYKNKSKKKKQLSQKKKQKDQDQEAMKEDILKFTEEKEVDHLETIGLLKDTTIIEIDIEIIVIEIKIEIITEIAIIGEDLDQDQDQIHHPAISNHPVRKSLVQICLYTQKKKCK